MGSCILNTLLKTSSLPLRSLSTPSSIKLFDRVNKSHYNAMPTRSTFIVQRARGIPKVMPRQRKPLKFTRHHFVYDTIQDAKMKLESQKDIEIILVNYVEGLGKAGDIVTVNPNYAYNNLLLPKLAVYASPENLANASLFKKSKSEEEYSSKTSKTLMRLLPYKTIPVVLNKDVEWTVQPWHIKASARKIGIHILNEAGIEIPGPPIQGPNLDFHGKDFLVILTLNNKEKIKMRCKLLLWATKAAERFPVENQFWCFRGEPINEEQAEDLNLLPIEQFNPDKVMILTKI